MTPRSHQEAKMVELAGRVVQVQLDRVAALEQLVQSDSLVSLAKALLPTKQEWTEARPHVALRRRSARTVAVL